MHPESTADRIWVKNGHLWLPGGDGPSPKNPLWPPPHEAWDGDESLDNFNKKILEETLKRFKMSAPVWFDAIEWMTPIWETRFYRLWYGKTHDGETAFENVHGDPKYGTASSYASIDLYSICQYEYKRFHGLDYDIGLQWEYLANQTCYCYFSATPDFRTAFNNDSDFTNFFMDCSSSDERLGGPVVHPHVADYFLMDVGKWFSVRPGNYKFASEHFYGYHDTSYLRSYYPLGPVTHIDEQGDFVRGEQWPEMLRRVAMSLWSVSGNPALNH